MPHMPFARSQGRVRSPRRRRSLRRLWNSTLSITPWGRETLRRSEEQPPGSIYRIGQQDSIRNMATWEEDLYTVQQRTILRETQANETLGSVLTLQQSALYGPGRVDQYPGPVAREPISRQIVRPGPPPTNPTTNWTAPLTPWEPSYFNNVRLYGRSRAETMLENAANRYEMGLMQYYYSAASSTNTVTVNWMTNITGLQWQYYGGVAAPETEAQRVARIAAEEARKVARVTAEKLLKRYLTDEQREEWERFRWITVRSQRGNVYQIREGSSRNIDLLVNGKPTKRYCIHPDDYEIPHGDVVLVQKLLLESDEDRFLKIANVSPARVTQGGLLLAA